MGQFVGYFVEHGFVTHIRMRDDPAAQAYALDTVPEQFYLDQNATIMCILY